MNSASAWHRCIQYGLLVLSAVRRRGLLTTVRIAKHEILFDLRYGTETKEYIEAEDIRTESKNKSQGHKYGPLQIPFFWKVFGAAGPVKDRGCYIDVGCGKGRTLLLAALAGFTEVIGVEYSAALINQCRKNIASFRSRTASTAKFEVIHADAADYEIPDTASTLVFYDPFSVVVFRQVMDNLQVSLNRSPRDVHIVVFNCSDAYKTALSRFERVMEDCVDKTLVCKTPRERRK